MYTILGSTLRDADPMPSSPPRSHRSAAGRMGCRDEAVAVVDAALTVPGKFC